MYSTCLLAWTYPQPITAHSVPCVNQFKHAESTLDSNLPNVHHIHGK
jgi:hypothetical protein